MKIKANDTKNKQSVWRKRKKNPYPLKKKKHLEFLTIDDEENIRRVIASPSYMEYIHIHDDDDDDDENDTTTLS